MKSISWEATNKQHEFKNMIASAYHHPSHSEKKMVKIWPGFQPLTLPKFNMEPKNDGFQVRIFWGISEYHFRQAKKKSGEPKVECLKLLEAKNQKNMIVFLVGGWTNPFKNMPWS